MTRKHEVIIIDCLGVLVGQQRGAERFICSLVEAFSRQYPERLLVLVNRRSRVFFEQFIDANHLLVLPLSGRNRVLRLLVQVLAGPVIARMLKAKVYVSSSVFPALRFPCPVAAFLLDLMVLHYPSIFGRFESLFRRHLLRYSIPTLSRILTISESSKSDIQGRFRGAARLVDVIPSGTTPHLAYRRSSGGEDEILQSLGLVDCTFVVSVLGGKRYKNQIGLAQAAEHLERIGRNDVLIVVVGDAIAVYREIGYPAQLRPLGVIDDTVLNVLYRHAKALVFPTLFEGLGLPVIEAQSAGLPVACSDIPVLREVSGGAAVFFSPLRPESIAQGILSLVDGTVDSQGLIRRGHDNVSRLTWAASAKALANVCNAMEARKSEEDNNETCQRVRSYPGIK